MTQHTCAVCRHTFGKSTFPGGSATYCSRACGTRWGAALLPKQPRLRPEPESEPEPELELPVICSAVLIGQTCTKCAALLPPRRRLGRRLTQCRGGCRPAPKPQPMRKCERCRRAFPVRHAGARFCSRPCVSRRHTTCTRPGCSKPHRAKGLCSGHYNDERYPDQRRQWPDDPEAKRKRDKIAHKVRRARKRGAHAENVDRDVVGERDAWRCGICRKQVDHTLDYPHRMSASLDHVVPLAEGGEHTYANARIAHLVCNVMRSNRGGGEQLALIG